MNNFLSGGFLKQTLSAPKNFLPQISKCQNGISLIHHDIGVLEVTLSTANKSIVISSGIHGNETAPLELIDDLVNDIIQQRFIPTARLLFIIAHPDAINANKRFIDENLNRLFAGQNVERNAECKIANKLQKRVCDFFSLSPESDDKWHIDLHSAIRDSRYPLFAVVPASTRKTDIRPLIGFAQSGKIGAMMLSKSPSSTFSYWTSEHFSALSATVEMGRVKPLYQNNMTDYLPLKATFQTLFTGGEFSTLRVENRCAMFQVSSTITKTGDSFRLTFDSQIANFSYFAEGELLAHENGCNYNAMKGGEAVVFPNQHVAIGQRACLLVQTICLDLSLPVYVPVQRNPKTVIHG